MGDTLLHKKPSDCEVLVNRCKSAGIYIDHNTAKHSLKNSEVWIGNQILREINGAPRMPDEEFRRNIDFISLKSFLIDKEDPEIWDIVCKLGEVNGESQSWVVIDGVRETLGTLKNNEYKLGIVSNFDGSLPSLLDDHRLSDYFEEIVISSIVCIEKPDERILNICCEKLGVKTSECLYVGDHPFDVLCAKKAGMDMVWICEVHDELPESVCYKEDHRISSIAELMRII